MSSCRPAVTGEGHSDRVLPQAERRQVRCLAEQARRLGRVRSEVWQRYGSVAGASLSDRQVRDRWLATGHHEQFGVLANAWKETVRDAMADIAAYRDAAKVKVRRAVNRRVTDPARTQAAVHGAEGGPVGG